MKRRSQLFTESEADSYLGGRQPRLEVPVPVSRQSLLFIASCSPAPLPLLLHPQPLPGPQSFHEVVSSCSAKKI